MTEGRSRGIPKILHAMQSNGSPPPLFDFDYLDGDDTAGSTDGGATVNGIANQALPADGDEITQILVDDHGLTGDGVGYNFAEIRPSDIQGMAWEDLNNDGGVNFCEKAIPGVSVTLTGTDDRGNAIGQIVNTTDGDGMYMFVDLRPGTYAIAQTQPDATYWVDAKDAGGEVGSGAHERARHSIAQ